MMTLPPSVQIVDGGLGGLNLLGFMEPVRTVVFVDQVSGFLEKPGILVRALPDPEIADDQYDHQAGLGYLMAVAPNILDRMPVCHLVGVEGVATDTMIQSAARCALNLVEKEGSEAAGSTGLSGATVQGDGKKH